MCTIWLVSGKPDPSMMCNGMLAGLVAITAPCAFVTPWCAFFIVGGLAGIIVVFSVFFFDRIGVDDAVGAISVHGVNGLWGILALGLFADGTYGAGFNGVHLFRLADGSLQALTDLTKIPTGAIEQGVTGLFYGNPKQFLCECIAGVTCFVWCFSTTAIIFGAIGKILGSNRVPAAVEIAGLDVPEMGIPGYPEFIKIMVPEDVPEHEVKAAETMFAKAPAGATM
jgi:Amt family ammonium transporter